MSNPVITLDDYYTLLKLDFYAFIERSFAQLNPESRFYRNWHIEFLTARLEAWRKGEVRRLIINLPPRNLKSHCASIALPAWILGHDPSAQILCVSYAQDLADKLARDCRSIMTSSWYQRLFPTRLSAQRQAVQEFATTTQGYRLSTSVGGVLTGRGADYIIIDDPLKPSEALSDALRRSANDWFDHTLFSRLNDKRTGRIMIIMQRLHEDDLVGHVLEREGWEVLSFPAIAEQDAEFVISNLYGSHRIIRSVGDVLHPEREPLEALRGIRQTVGEYNFAAQYQQSPAPLEGGLVKAAWFRSYRKADLPSHFGQIIQSWDTANTLSELSDYSVCTTWGLKGKNIYLIDVFRQKVNYPELKRAVKRLAQTHCATVVLIEDRASGTQLIQELIGDGLHAVKSVKPEGDKVMRLNAQTATIENGFVHLPDEAPWLAQYVHELTTFPGAKYDDQVDSTSQALSFINQTPLEPANIRYYRLEAARTMHEQGFALEAIAQRLEITPEEIQAWLDDHARWKLEWEQRRFPDPPCAHCGGKFLINAVRTQTGGRVYHHECWRKLTFVERLG
jgi:predicted phage terminase large subunit-like protein